MKSLRKCIILLISFLMIGGIALKAIPLLEWGYLGANEKNIYNNEGRVVSDTDTYSYLYKKSKEIGENSIDCRFTDFVGIATVYKFTSKEEATITLKYESEIFNGKLKILLVTPENEIINIAEGSSNVKYETKIKKGISKIKIVGNNCSGTFQASLISDKNIKSEIKS